MQIFVGKMKRLSYIKCDRMAIRYGCEHDLRKLPTNFEQMMSTCYVIPPMEANLILATIQIKKLFVIGPWV
ncbi:MAG TPA: hypothetical protein V6D22_20690 [Candidatus Obscuribacterales bacterium]